MYQKCAVTEECDRFANVKNSCYYPPPTESDPVKVKFLLLPPPPPLNAVGSPER